MENKIYEIEIRSDNRGGENWFWKSLYILTGVAIVFLLIYQPDLSEFYNGEKDVYYSVSSQVIKDQFSHTSEMHWDHMPLTYSYNDVCAEWMNGRYPGKIKEALDHITNDTGGTITFILEKNEEPDISFVCYKSKTSSPTWGKDTYLATVADAEINYFVDSNIYAPGKINLYEMGSCVHSTRPSTIIHETLHLLGLGHTPEGREYMYDAMYPKVVNCAGRISEENVNYLRSIYG